MESKIRIKNPCTAGAKEMQRMRDGYFCSDCNLVVNDFTRLSDEELKNWFSAHGEKKVCGIYRDDQVEISAFKKFLFPFRYAAVAIVALFAAKEAKAQRNINFEMPAADSSKTISLYGDTVVKKVTGKVISSKTGKGIENVYVYLNYNSKVVADTLTAIDGTFEILVPCVEGQQFYFTAGAFGFKDHEIEGFSITENQIVITLEKEKRRLFHRHRRIGSKF